MGGRLILPSSAVGDNPARIAIGHAVPEVPVDICCEVTFDTALRIRQSNIPTGRYYTWKLSPGTGALTLYEWEGAETPGITLTMDCKVGIGDVAPGEKLDVAGNANVTGVYKIDDVQVVSNRVIDARIADAINSGDATTDGVIDALRDAMITHGLIAAA